MLSDDFFSFCTSLPVPELRAIGALSRVKHYAEGELVYAPGAESKEFFIINRGLVEVIPGPDQPGGSVVLCRGNIFGETGAFARTPRDHTARAGHQHCLLSPGASFAHLRRGHQPAERIDLR